MVDETRTRERKTSRVEASWLSRLLPRDWFPKEQREGLDGLLRIEEFAAFNKSIQQRSGDVDSLTALGDQLANIALEAEAHGKRGDTRRVIWGVTSKTTGSLTAVLSAAVGGTVLAVNQLPSWGRYVLASVAFLAAALGALQPGQEFAADVHRHLLYTSLHHRIVQYVVVSLPEETLRQATTELNSFSSEFDEIRGVQPNSAAVERSRRLAFGHADQQAHEANAEGPGPPPGAGSG